MLLIAFIAVLAAVWLAFTLTAFCPLRAWRQRRVLTECEEIEVLTPVKAVAAAGR